MATHSQSAPGGRVGGVGTGYLILGAVYLVVLVIMTVTAAIPGWTDRDGPGPLWLSVAMSPGAWYTALAMAVVALILAHRVNTVSPSPPGRFDPYMAAFLISSSMILSFTAYTACQAHYVPPGGGPFTGIGPFDAVVRPLIDSIALFAFSYYDPFITDLGHCDYVPPLAMLTSRFIAVVATFSAVLAVIISLGDRAKDLRRIRRASEVDVAIGLDADSTDFLASIARKRRSDPTSNSALVVLTRLPDREEVTLLRSEGALVIAVDLDSHAAIRDVFRSTPLKNLYLLHKDAAVNIRRFDLLVSHWEKASHRSVRSRIWGWLMDAVHYADDVLSGDLPPRTDAATPVSSLGIHNAVVRIDNVWDAEDWRAHEIGRRDIRVSVVGLYESTAQALVHPFRHPTEDVLREKFGETRLWTEVHPTRRECPPRSTTDFVVCGPSQLTLGVLSALARSAYEEGRLREALGASDVPSDAAGGRSGRPGSEPTRVTVHLVSPEASFIAESFTERIRRRRLLAGDGVNSNPIRVRSVNEDPTFQSVSAVLASIASSDVAARPVVIITDSPSTRSTLLGTTIADLQPLTGAVFEHNDAVWTPVSTGTSRLRQYGLNLGAPMGDPGEAARAIASLDDARAIAELLHAEYLVNWVSPVAAAPEAAERRPAQRLWATLDPFLRRDNERPVLVALQELRELSKLNKSNSSTGSEGVLVPPPSESEAASLERWLDPRHTEDALSNRRTLYPILEALCGSELRRNGRKLDHHDARAVFIALARAEHESWLAIRQASRSRWRRPTVAERGFAPKNRPDGTSLAFDPRLVTPRLQLESLRLSPEVLAWEDLVSTERQIALLREELVSASAGTPRASDLVDQELADYCALVPLPDPAKVFGQVVTVLCHLDALGYLSAVLGAPAPLRSSTETS